MYVQGVSTRKVRAATEELYGHGFSARSVSAITVHLDAELDRFMGRALMEEYAYLIINARYERVREAGASPPALCWRPSASIGTVAVRCWPWSWPTGRAPPRGGTS